MSAYDGLLASLLAVLDGASLVAVGTVKSFAPTGTDPPLVTVTWQGRDVLARCPRSYTPVEGHLVVMLRHGPQLLILDAY